MRNADKGQEEIALTERGYPREYFAAPVLFASRISQLSTLSIIDAIDRYTGLYREVTARRGLEGDIDQIWLDMVEKVKDLKDPEAITQVVYDTYLAQPHSLYNPNRNEEQATLFGALGYFYNFSSHQARIHFFPKRSTVSALSSCHFQERREDFRHLLLDLHREHPEVETIKSSTWLHNLSNYRNLFPQKFQARLRNVGGSSYLGLWGQFVKGDGSGNRERLELFRRQLWQAQTMDEAIDAFPFMVLEAVGPVYDFYAEYGV